MTLWRYIIPPFENWSWGVLTWLMKRVLIWSCYTTRHILPSRYYTSLLFSLMVKFGPLVLVLWFWSFGFYLFSHPVSVLGPCLHNTRHFVAWYLNDWTAHVTKWIYWCLKSGPIAISQISPKLIQLKRVTNSSSDPLAWWSVDRILRGTLIIYKLWIKRRLYIDLQTCVMVSWFIWLLGPWIVDVNREIKATWCHYIKNFEKIWHSIYLVNIVGCQGVTQLGVLYQSFYSRSH